MQFRVCGLVGGGSVNEGDEGKRILVGFIYIYEIEQ
jgi:hypothetical protein